MPTGLRLGAVVLEPPDVPVGAAAGAEAGAGAGAVAGAAPEGAPGWPAGLVAFGGFSPGLAVALPGLGLPPPASPGGFPPVGSGWPG